MLQWLRLCSRPRRPRFNPWSEDQAPHTETKDPSRRNKNRRSWVSQDPAQPNKNFFNCFQKLGEAIVVLDESSSHVCSVMSNSARTRDPMVCHLPGSSAHGCPRQEWWSGLLFPSSGDLLNPGIKPASARAGGFFTAPLQKH